MFVGNLGFELSENEGFFLEECSWFFVLMLSGSRVKLQVDPYSREGCVFKIKFVLLALCK